MPAYDKSLPRLNKRGFGRPTKRTKEVEKIILDAIADGAPFTLACSYAGITMETFIDWRRSDPTFQAEVERVVADCALRRLRKIEKHGEENFAACCWLLERRHPELFGRPEIQLAIVQQNTTVENSLTINITSGEAVEIEREAAPIRESVARRIAAYRPMSSQASSESGNGEEAVRAQEAEPVAQQSWEPPPISHRETDATNPAFWRALVDSPPERKVSRATAVFAVRTILAQRLGFKAHRMQITFGSDPITVEEMFGVLEKLSGGSAGWQLAQKLAG